jgi:hypothetical protein
MAAKQTRRLVLGLALAAVFTIGSGCAGEQPSTSPVGAGRNAPDRVQIMIHLLQPPGGNNPVVTLTDVSRVQQLYSSVVGLPPLSDNAVCPTNRSLSYTLTFLREGDVLTTVSADSSGCGTVSIAGDKPDRQANQAFWSQLEHDITLAASAARPPDQLAILHRSQLDQPPQTALLTSTITVLRLYQAIRQLPSGPQYGSCAAESLPEYLLVFYSPEQTIPAVLNQTCQTIFLERGNFPSPIVTDVMTAPFEQLFEQTLAEASFAPARPDQLTVQMQMGSGAPRQITVTDASLRQQIYMTTFTLPTVTTPPNCPPYNENHNTVAANGTWYTFEFRQWDLLTVALVDAYEGSCRLVFLDFGWGGISNGQILQADSAFWDLVHQAALE